MQEFKQQTIDLTRITLDIANYGRKLSWCHGVMVSWCHGVMGVLWQQLRAAIE